MSGYPSQRYDGRSLAGARVPLLRKPFTASELAQRVRAALDG
jgi:DNA-binding response OmpR family regulator